MINTRDLLLSLLKLSEKAANIARLIRQDPDLLSMLVREKGDAEKNPRFYHDFKTFADVLIQAVVTNELETCFAELQGQVHGEESLEFDSLDGSLVTVGIRESKAETAAMLLSILGEGSWVETLASELHQVQESSVEVPESLPALNESVAVWIDPIDSTAEYIAGHWSEESIAGRGLYCVTVLLGVYDQSTGAPILGVMNRPFARQVSANPPRWEGECIYGFSHNGINVYGPDHLFSSPTNEKTLVVSSSDCGKLREILKRSSSEWNAEEVAGAGFKLWRVATGSARSYALSMPTVFPWDICAGQAILNARGGSVKAFSPPHPDLVYGSGHESFADGVFATINTETFEELSSIFN